MSNQTISLPLVDRTAVPRSFTVAGTGAATVALPAVSQTATPQAPTPAGEPFAIVLPTIQRTATNRRGPRVRRS